MGVTNYHAGLCFYALDMKIPSQRLSVSVKVFNRAPAILEVSVLSSRGNSLQVLKIRFLVASPTLSYIYIHELVSTTSYQFYYTNKKKYYVKLTVATFPNPSCRFIIFLSGFDMTAWRSDNDFDLLVSRSSSTNTSITIKISSDVHMTLKNLSCTIVVINSKEMVNQLGGGFMWGNRTANYTTSLSVSKPLSLVYDNNTFFGVRSFHTINKNALTLTCDNVNNTLSMTSPVQLDYLLMSYIIFTVDPCPPPKFVYAINGSCLTSCPMGYLGNSVTREC